jgi:hypothetical protein
MKKQKIKRETVQDVVEVVSSNTFASIQQVSEDNLKEFLVSRSCFCILEKKKINFTLPYTNRKSATSIV